jgi:hypothetical protein
VTTYPGYASEHFNDTGRNFGSLNNLLCCYCVYAAVRHCAPQSKARCVLRHSRVTHLICTSNAFVCIPPQRCGPSLVEDTVHETRVPKHRASSAGVREMNKGAQSRGWKKNCRRASHSKRFRFLIKCWRGSHHHLSVALQVEKWRQVSVGGRWRTRGSLCVSKTMSIHVCCPGGGWRSGRQTAFF